VFQIANLFPYWFQIKFSMNFLKKAGQSMVLISCSKSCGTQAQLTGGQAVADRAVPAPKKMLNFFFRSSRSLPLTWFCRLSGEATENTFLSIQKTKSVAYCMNFWSRSLARFMRAAQFASVSSCARCLLKHFRYKSFTNNLALRRPMNTHLPWYLTDGPVGLQLVLLIPD